jgi:hypothetical protein
MNTENLTPQDQFLWEKAKKRAGFKQHLLVYIVVNLFLIATWFFSSSGRYFWPIWTLLGWGIGLAFNYLDAYSNNKFFSAEEEFKKLKLEAE